MVVKSIFPIQDRDVPDFIKNPRQPTKREMGDIARNLGDLIKLYSSDGLGLISYKLGGSEEDKKRLSASGLAEVISNVSDDSLPVFYKLTKGGRQFVEDLLKKVWISYEAHECMRLLYPK